MKRQIAVNIFGQRYMLRADEDESTVRELAAYVDARLREVQKHTRTADTQTLAVLAALQIAEELHRERGDHAELRRRVREKSRTLLQLLEREARV
jgi:cell division protein ZapA